MFFRFFRIKKAAARRTPQSILWKDSQKCIPVLKVFLFFPVALCLTAACASRIFNLLLC